MKFVRIDPQYIARLNKLDSRVQYTDPKLGKASKPFLGVLFNQGNFEYFAPISSPKPKHLQMSNGRDFHKILDVNGSVLAVINFNNMVPVTPALYQRIDFNLDKDGRLLKKEYAFCAKNASILSKKASDLYGRYTKEQLTLAEQKRTCDFRALEKEMQGYLAGFSQTQSNLKVSNNGVANSVVPVDQSAQQLDGTANDAQGVGAQAPSQDAASQSAVSSQLLSMVSNIPAAQQAGRDAQNQAAKKNDNVNE